MKYILYVVGLLVGVGILYAGYYFVSPFFRKSTLDEAVPQAVSPVGVTDTSADKPANVTKSDVMVVPDKPVTKQTPAAAPVPQKPSVPATVPAPVAVNEPAQIVGTPGHRASGTVRLVNTAGGDVVRYENFSTVNGPDLFVYLATDLEATDYIDLGALKATDGNINYAVPPGTDTKKYPYVLVWCKQFGVLFNSAKIN